ncbi:MAG: biotin/lipoyl-binding protein [Prevotellaceae bacterium]|jgi:biotin carboxyl carrier protein|nr:biotin/lipoyl-binding protein [Prevotellaceae bacterium]
MKKFKFNIGNQPYEVDVLSTEGNIVELDVNGKTYKVELDEATAPAAPAKPTPAAPAAKPAPAPAAPVAAPAPAAAQSSGGAVATVKSPLPGSVLKIAVSEGTTVKDGDLLLIMESMKMENNIVADAEGVVKKIHVTVGQSVMQDDALVDIG